MKSSLHTPPSDVLARAVEVSRLMKTLAHPQRLCLLCHLSASPRTVGELAILCELPQPQVSQFLARLKTENLVQADRDGRRMVYCIVDARVTAVMQSLAQHFCTLKDQD